MSFSSHPHLLRTITPVVLSVTLAFGLGVGSANAEYVSWTNASGTTNSGDMETGDFSGWSGAGGISLANDYSVSATHSFKLEKFSSDATCQAITFGGDNIWWPIAVTTGQTYTFSWDQKYSLTGGVFWVSLYGTNDTLITQFISTNATSGNGGADFDHITREITIPTGVTGVQINVNAAVPWRSDSVGDGSTIWVDNFALSQVPEPSSFVIMAAGLLGLLAYAWRKRQ